MSIQIFNKILILDIILMNMEKFQVNLDDFIQNTFKNSIISGSCCVSFEIQKDINIRCAVKRDFIYKSN